ncbi:MAG: TPR repeat-containing [Geobacteraceae bacterium]|nr:MAG: TPR repeat-containing [Geobacteraceae bacterium]
MGLLKKGVPVAFLLALSGCASQGDMQNTQRDMDEVKTRIFQMEKDLGGVRSETKEGIEKTIKGFQTDIETLRKGTADLQATLDSAKVDMQVLTGKVDDVALMAKKPTEDISLMKEDSDRRLATIEDRIQKLEKGFEEFQKKVVETRTKDLEKSPDVLYQKALDTFRGGNPQKARELFTRFIELYPNHELAANAHYWLGETFYGDKKYDQAILEFQQIIKNFPGKEKVPAAMLKQAMAFKELGDVKSARYVLKKLIDDFPFAEEVKTAKEKLKEYK